MTHSNGCGSNQRATLFGNEQMKCLICWTIISPNDLIYFKYRPEEGRRYNSTLLRNSVWENSLLKHLLIGRKHFCIFRDSACLLRAYMMRLLAFDLVSTQKVSIKVEMSFLVVTIEHDSKHLTHFWSALNYARQLKVRSTLIGLLYSVTKILTNFERIFTKARRQLQASNYHQ